METSLTRDELMQQEIALREAGELKEPVESMTYFTDLEDLDNKEEEVGSNLS